MFQKLRLTLLILAFSELYSFSQVNYPGIHFQGQFAQSGSGFVELDILIISNTLDTVWREKHPAIEQNEEGVFFLTIGQGDFVSGNVSQFSEINWLDIATVELIKVTVSDQYVIASMGLFALPYAYHSVKIFDVPAPVELYDVIISPVSMGSIFRYDGTGYYFSFDMATDSAVYAWTSISTDVADASAVSIVAQFTADTTEYSNWVDTANYAQQIGTSFSADTAIYAEQTDTALISLGNWTLTGNSNLADTNFVGTIVSQELVIKTNSTTRLVFGNDQQTYNSIAQNGFAIHSVNGALFQSNSAPGLNYVTESSMLYFNGQKSSFLGGYNNSMLDTTMRLGSFGWGYNSSPNGMYAASFGYNVKGDSTFVAGVGSDASAMFSAGRNNIATLYSIALGDSARATYTRNVAIGKNVLAGSQSASVAVGTNVTATGATSWAVGKNLVATGNFSTLMGTYATTGTFKSGFLFGDLSSSTYVSHTAIFQFMVRASGGYVFYSAPDLTAGVSLSAGGGSWNMISDINRKRFISSIDYNKYSELILSIPLYKWSYIDQSERHIGPMAQDFYRHFGVGEMNTHINMLDIDGVVFTGIIGLNQTINQALMPEEVEELEIEISKESEKLDSLENRIKLLYEKIDNN